MSVNIQGIEIRYYSVWGFGEILDTLELRFFLNFLVLWGSGSIVDRDNSFDGRSGTSGADNRLKSGSAISFSATSNFQNKNSAECGQI